MGHLIKYRFLQTVREWSIMFWALAFPIVLGTFFNISFGSGDLGEDMEVIPVAIIEEAGQSDSKTAFKEFLNQLDQDTIEIKEMDEEQALKELKGDGITGIYYIRDEKSLTVAKSDIETSILKSLLDSYNKNEAVIMKIAKEHPENLGKAMEEIGDFRTMTEDVSLSGKTTNPSISYFFALIAFACLSGAYLGVEGSFSAQANLSALGARRSVTPTHKLKLVIIDMIVLFTIQYINILILTLVIRYAFGVSLGGNIPGILLIDLLGSLIGVSIGIMIGCIRRLPSGIKMGVTVASTLIPSFLAGLMFGNMKNLVEQHLPILNRINPAAVLSDAFYCLGVYNDTARFTRSLIILGVMSVLFMGIAFMAVRRERYDSI